MERQAVPAAKCGTVVVCFLAIILGQGVLCWRAVCAGASAPQAALLGELVFCVVMLAAVIWCWTHPKGWGGNRGCVIAAGIFVVYLLFNLLYYRAFAQLYLAGIDTEFPSWGKALVTVKLVLAMMGVVAGIPAAPAPSGREYAEKMRQAVYRQEAEWAKGNAKGAKKDFEKAMAKLKENLSPQEMQALLAQLRTEAPQEQAAAPSETTQEDGIAETWRGWGGGT